MKNSDIFSMAEDREFRDASKGMVFKDYKAKGEK